MKKLLIVFLGILLPSIGLSPIFGMEEKRCSPMHMGGFSLNHLLYIHLSPLVSEYNPKPNYDIARMIFDHILEHKNEHQNVCMPQEAIIEAIINDLEPLKQKEARIDGIREELITYIEEVKDNYKEDVANVFEVVLERFTPLVIKRSNKRAKKLRKQVVSDQNRAKEEKMEALVQHYSNLASKEEEPGLVIAIKITDLLSKIDAEQSKLGLTNITQSMKRQLINSRDKALGVKGTEQQLPCNSEKTIGKESEEIENFIANKEEWISREMDQKNISRAEAIRVYKAELDALKSLCEQRWD